MYNNISKLELVTGSQFVNEEYVYIMANLVLPPRIISNMSKLTFFCF